jgi:hypothetical protein
VALGLEVIVLGAPYSLSDGVTCKLVQQDGVGLPPLHRISERGPQQHGESDRGFRLDPRIVLLVLGVTGDTMYVKRDELVSRFKPRDDPIALRWTRDDGAVRQLDCFYIEQMTLPSNVVSRYYMRVPAQFKAADPTFYDPDLEHVVFAITLGAEEFVVPLPIPWPIGAAVLDATTAINYAGTWRTYPIITITGPVTDCVVTNVTTGEKLDFTGVTIAAANVYTIDLRYGQKTVVNQAGTNKVADLTTDSDLSTWHLEAAPDAVGGVNSIHVTGTSGSAATGVTIEYYARYISL